MLTKYYIEIDGIKHEIPKRCVMNWAEIHCAYKRANFSGVTRSFSSQFEFVKEAYDMIMNLYLRDGFTAEAILSIHTITDRWEWVEQFAAPIDFSSITWDDYVLRVNCIDNSLAAQIKANKSTKYEFLVGDEVLVAMPMNFDRVPMIETLDYEVIGESQEDSSAMRITIRGGSEIYRIPTYLKKSSIRINGSLDFGDQTDEKDSYFIKAEKDVAVTLRGGIAVDITNLQDQNFLIAIYKTSGDETIKVLDLYSQSWAIGYKGEYDTPSDLPTSFLLPLQTALVKSTNTVWELRVKENPIQDYPYEWVDTGRSLEEYINDCDERETVVELKAGDTLWIGATANSGTTVGYPRYWVDVLNQTIEISWSAQGEPEMINTIAPKDLCAKILERICMGKHSVEVTFSDYDARLANTYLLAAESVRALDGAKIYSSFDEFINWMQTVFGYTYYLDSQAIHFVHRSELFSSDANLRRIERVRETTYTVDPNIIYSSVSIGYEKQDYEDFNGRDEFNFNNTYATGYTGNEKILSLISKYRADSYGIEFAVQKRGEDTTDTTSDNDVFFVLAKIENEMLVPDRSISIENTITDKVFNGAFSPMACVLANAGYIGMQAKNIHLEFASSEGNSSVVIGGRAMSGDIDIDTPLMTCGMVSFITDDLSEVDDPANQNDLVEIESGGVLYRGFIEEAIFKYATNAAVQYNLIVKDIEL